MFKKIAVGILALVGLAVAPLYASAQISVASSTEIITGVVDDISDTLSGGLPVLFTLVGILIGLFFVIRQVKKWIGRGK